MISKNYKYRGQWLGARKKRVSATDISVLMGTNPYKSVKKLCKEKLGLVESPDLSDQPFVVFGQDVEHLFLEKSNIESLEVPETAPWVPAHYDQPGEMCIQVHTEDDWASCTADFFGYKKVDNAKFCPVEIKTGASGKFLQVPAMYRDQVLWQLHVTEAEFGLLVALIIPDDMIRDEWLNYSGYKVKEILLDYIKNNMYSKTFLIERDEERIQEMRSKALDFYNKVEQHRATMEAT